MANDFSPPDRSKIVGILLAGGQSRRMFEGSTEKPGDKPTLHNGPGDKRSGDKGLLDIAGRPMLGHVIERLRPQVSTLAINANGDPSRFAAFGLPVVADPIEGFPGPLAGVLAGMQWAARHAPGVTHIATVSTDAPFMPPDLVPCLVAAITSDKPIALAASGGELHPVIGLWPVALAHDLETQLRNGVRKVLAWTDRHGTSAVEFPMLVIGGNRVDPFFNANTPAELDEARRLLARDLE
ncbi:MAG: molybdenum cofactor guanylyltransferase MobA [Hyphomicrobium aestuarii]|nr:molybdenum cofactor guanylyltransferase MobA [Hyphomicrobium aestuarii]